jgi:magnesium transporter
MIVDNAIYIDGRRASLTVPIEHTYETCKDNRGIAWIGLYKPTQEEFDLVTREFDLHELAVEDAIQAHQRPKIERYDNVLFVVLKAARYVDRAEEVEFAELHVFVGEDFVVTVRHGEGSELTRVRRRMEADPDMLRLGPEAILYGILDRVVDDYGPVVRGLENDIDEIEIQVFGGTGDVTRRTYELTREIIEFQRATKPLVGILSALINGAEKYGVTEELQEYLRDVLDHAVQVQEQIAGFRELLQNVLSVNMALLSLQQNDEIKAMTQASIEQNDEVKRISSWAAIVFTPTLIGTIYGMNFDNQPELHWRYGYPLALLMMVAVSYVMYAVFKRKGWLS